MMPPALEQIEQWGSPVEVETRRRIHVAIATYAYEIADNPIMSDSQWDWLAQSIQPRMATGHPLLDEFFIVRFSPMTGMWIHDHPQLDLLEQNYRRFGVPMRKFYAGLPD